MGLTRRAVLFSGLVFPGMGQWLLGRRVKAVLIGFWIVLLLLALMARIFVLVSDAIMPGGDIIMLDLSPATLSAVHHQAYVDNWWLLVIIAAIWIYSMVDAYLEGKKLERSITPGTGAGGPGGSG